MNIDPVRTSPIIFVHLHLDTLLLLKRIVLHVLCICVSRRSFLRRWTSVQTAAWHAQQFGVGRKTNRFSAMHVAATTNCTRFSSL